MFCRATLIGRRCAPCPVLPFFRLDAMTTSETPVSLSIAAVERDTGLGKDTLRVWERRYGFPQPTRDAQGERLYPMAQVEQLRHIRRLMDAGHRPGRIVGLGLSELVAMSRQTSPRAAGEPEPSDDDLLALLALVRAHEPAGLRAACAQALMQQGLARFVLRTAVPLCVAVGDAWARGELAVFEEHLCSEALETVLRSALGGVGEPPSQARPRVLLTTLPSEQHGLAVLMAQALFAAHGARCVSLGTQLPLTDIVRAAHAHQSDIVALSFSAAHPVQQVLDGLTELRALLPAPCAVWAGCPTPAVRRRGVSGVTIFDRLDDIALALQAWRAAQGG